MDWLEKAKQALNKAAEQISVEARILKLQAELGALEEERKRQFALAGERAYELRKRGEIHDPELKVILRRVDELNEQIEALRAEIAKLKAEGGEG